MRAGSQNTSLLVRASENLNVFSKGIGIVNALCKADEWNLTIDPDNADPSLYTSSTTDAMTFTQKFDSEIGYSQLKI